MRRGVAIVVNEQTQINAIAHGPEARIIDVNVVAEIKGRAEPRWMRGVAHARIEVDDAVEDGIASNPTIHLEPDSIGSSILHGGGVVSGSFERRERSYNCHQAVIVSESGYLRQAEDYVDGCHWLSRVECSGGYVVVPF